MEKNNNILYSNLRTLETGRIRRLKLLKTIQNYIELCYLFTNFAFKEQNTSAKYECNIDYIALIFNKWKIKGANIFFFDALFYG